MTAGMSDKKLLVYGTGWHEKIEMCWHETGVKIEMTLAAMFGIMRK